MNAQAVLLIQGTRAVRVAAPTGPKILNREAWLNELASKHLWPLIRTNDGEVKSNVRISVGFPKGSRGGRKSIGQCWPTSASTDKTFEVFVSPILSSFDAAHVLLHELVHASVGLSHGHKGPFKQLAVAVGFTGKMTATVPGPKLRESIKRWLKVMPAFPHGAMRDFESPSKQSTRLVKCKCPSCGYTVRVTRKWLEVGNPLCPDGDEMEQAS